MRGILLLMVLAIVIQTLCASPFDFGSVGRKIEETARNTMKKLPATDLFSQIKSAVKRTPTTTTIPPTTVKSVVGGINETTRTTTTPPTPTVNVTTKAAVITCKPDGAPSRSFLSEDAIRMKLCPNATSSGYRFDLDSKVCSPVGQRSHCGKNMIFYSFAGNAVYGHCDCDYASQTPLLFHVETNRCYFMYQEAFCGTGQWLEMRKEDRKGICTTNTCINAGRTKFGAAPLAARDVEPEYVPLKGVGPCVKLNQPNQQFCKKKGEVVTFRWPQEFYPNCGAVAPPPLEVPSTRFLGDLPSLECSPGSYLDIVGHCQPHWDFD
ncbi:hypothetical protein Ocin01_07847 [Orchesella cincta]|uniref:DUF4789 domain-containing protein n=1 Tax=Orchesella cincta TaxID=48709 RepID=A0A1D2N0L7_ORCCI|nr:hypothetical protein Ocin01_07847 [Orchesella cincta]